MNTKEITNYIFLDDKNPSGDIALVFGTWNAWKESVEKAAELYKNGFVPKNNRNMKPDCILRVSPLGCFNVDLSTELILLEYSYERLRH